MVRLVGVNGFAVATTKKEGGRVVDRIEKKKVQRFGNNERCAGAWEA